MALENKYPTRTPDHKLSIPKENQFNEMPVPTPEIFDTPEVCFPAINYEWAAYITGRLHDLADEQRWAGDEETKWFARQQIEEFVSYDQTCPEEATPGLWVKVFDFVTNDGGFTVVAGAGGQYNIAWQSTPVTGGHELHIERSFEAREIEGCVLYYNLLATSNRAITVKTFSPETTLLAPASPISQINQENYAEAAGIEGVTNIKIRLFGTATTPNIAVRRMALWGVGDNPF